VNIRRDYCWSFSYADFTTNENHLNDAKLVELLNLVSATLFHSSVTNDSKKISHHEKKLKKPKILEKSSIKCDNFEPFAYFYRCDSLPKFFLQNKSMWLVKCIVIENKLN
jgi:hypothetical protein